MAELNYDVRRINNLADLEAKIIRDRKKANGLIDGYMGEVYAPLLLKLRGLKSGIVCVVAQGNVGKTIFAVSLGIDILNYNYGKSDCPRIVVYCFDDSYDDAVNMIVGFLSNRDRNVVACPNTWGEEDERDITAGYAKYKTYLDDKKLEIVELDNIKDWANLEIDMERQIKINPRSIFIVDGISHIDYQKGAKRLEANEAKSVGLKLMALKKNVPIIVTQEVAKGCGKRPTMENIAETRRWAYDSRVILAMSDLDDKAKKTNSKEDAPFQYPEIVLDIIKNKMAEYKKYFFAILKTDTCHLEIISATAGLRGRKVAYEYDKEYNEKKEEK